MSLSQNAQTIVTSLVNAIKGQISSHYNITGNSSTRGHVQAGGAPQTIGTSSSAGTDNGYYARADHVHTCSYNNLTDKPTIPTNTNQLTNGAGFITSSNLPTKTSDLTNDSGFLTEHNPIDSELSSTSTNAVQNKVVQESINGLSNGFTQAIGGVYTQLNSHSHGNITNTGTIGTTANKPLITTTHGKITTGSFGTTQNTFCQGNDSRLSDARTPLTHNHTKSEITDFPTIPSKTSDLTNDSGFLTSHQDITGKVNVSDIRDNLTSTDTNKPLSANQGKVLKGLVDGKASNTHTQASNTITDMGTVELLVTYADNTTETLTLFKKIL